MFSTPAQAQASRLFMSHIKLVQYVAFVHAPMDDLQGDIVNDAFVEFVTHADRWDMNGNIKALLIKITQNTAKYYWRKKLREMPEKMRLIADHVREVISQNETTATELDEEQLALGHCLGNLSPNSRELIKKHYFEEVPLAQMTVMDQKPMALYKAISRIRATLRECVEKILRKGGKVS